MCVALTNPSTQAQAETDTRCQQAETQVLTRSSSLTLPCRPLQLKVHWCTGSMRVCLPKRHTFCSFRGFFGAMVTSLSKVPNLSLQASAASCQALAAVTLLQGLHMCCRERAAVLAKAPHFLQLLRRDRTSFSNVPNLSLQASAASCQPPAAVTFLPKD